MTDDIGLLEKLREKGRSIPRPSFSTREMAWSFWDDLKEALNDIANAIRSLWRSTP